MLPPSSSLQAQKPTAPSEQEDEGSWRRREPGRSKQDVRKWDTNELSHALCALNQTKMLSELIRKIFLRQGITVVFKKNKKKIISSRYTIFEKITLSKNLGENILEKGYTQRKEKPF